LALTPASVSLFTEVALDRLGVTLILLNGISSSGKSSISQVLQQTLDHPYLQVSLDAFAEMLPDRYEEQGAFAWETLFPRMLRGFHQSIAALASTGNSLIMFSPMHRRPSIACASCLMTPFPSTSGVSRSSWSLRFWSGSSKQRSRLPGHAQSYRWLRADLTGSKRIVWGYRLRICQLTADSGAVEDQVRWQVAGGCAFHEEAGSLLGRLFPFSKW
jgi:hypothetical protein